MKDIWRAALRHQKGNFKLERFSCVNVKGIGVQTVSFDARLVAVCGENGVGKTTLLKTLFVALTPKTAARFGISLRPQNPSQAVFVECTITAKIKDEADGKIKIKTISDPSEIGKILRDDDDGESCLVTYTDAAALSQRLVHSINNDSEFSTALEGLEGKSDSPEALALRSEITGRRYSQVITYELEDYSDLPVFPYFKVKVGETSYGSEEMGLGELCVNYLVWALDRLQSDTLLLLEEPESHLPPRAQERLMAHIAELVVEKNIFAVVSTHSQHTLENIPPPHIIFLGRFNDQCIVQKNPQITTLYDSLRISKSNSTIALVEDHSAFAFLNAMIEKIEPGLLDKLDFVWKSGYSDLDELLVKFPSRSTCRTALLGVYDGDQRNQARPMLNWPCVYLPGDSDPAEYMRAAVLEMPKAFSDKLSYELTGMQIAVANIQAADVKDFFPRLANSVNRNVQALYQAAAETWLELGTNLKIAEVFVAEFKKHVFK